MDTSQLAQALSAKHWHLALAESCTGGMVSAACTDLAGSSAWFDRGFVTYSNAAKNDLLGVPYDVITQYGAVSEPVAAAMAQGALRHSQAQIAASITGIAGPGGETPNKPVGTVCFAIAHQHSVHTQTQHFAGDRHSVRVQATAHIVQWLCTFIASHGMLS
jgi:nicotinamide-nucleotide amidase